jgi:hypothetical protein
MVETKHTRVRKKRVDDRNPFDTPAKRKLKAISKQPYRVLRIRKGLILEYRRNEGDGTWQAKVKIGEAYTRFRLGAADDFSEANGKDVLTFEQAIAKAKKVAGEQAAGDDTAASAPATVADAGRPEAPRRRALQRQASPQPSH